MNNKLKFMHQADAAIFSSQASGSLSFNRAFTRILGSRLGRLRMRQADEST
jgi:hypothetical protein